MSLLTWVRCVGSVVEVETERSSGVWRRSAEVVCMSGLVVFSEGGLGGKW
jgi:hypothetical protein